MIGRVVAALVIASSLVGAAPVAQAAKPVRFLGVVQNGTRGADVPPGLVVTITQRSPSGGEVAHRTAHLDRSGRFSAGPFDALAGDGFVIATTYKGVSYETVADPPGGTARIGLEIFETTRDPAVISIASDTSIATQQSSEVLAVLTMMRVRNGSDRTYIGDLVEGAPAVLRLPVPRGAFDLESVEGLTHERIIDAPDGVAAGDPLQPGETPISYAYRVRTTDGRWNLARPVRYPTERADLLVQPELLVTTPGQNLGRLTFQGIEYRQLEFGPLLPDQLLVASVEQPGSAVPLLVPAGAAVILVALAYFQIARRRRRRHGAGEPPDDRERLLGAIAVLDMAFAAGDMEEPEYRSRRKAIKKELVSVGHRRDD